jgi:predicted lipid-binding transport protein (Tim44 family)
MLIRSLRRSVSFLFLRCQIDHTFNYLDFIKEMEEFMIPEVVGAFRVGDMQLLQRVTEGAGSSAIYQSIRTRVAAKVDWDPRILNIDGVDIVKASIHDDLPYIQLTFVCQHVDRETNSETGELINTASVKPLQNTYYSWAMRRDYESPLYNWKIFEFHYQHVASIA